MKLLSRSVMPCIREDCEDEEFYYQQDGAPPYYHRDARSLLDDILPDWLVGRRGFIEYHLHSPDITPLDISMRIPNRQSPLRNMQHLLN